MLLESLNIPLIVRVKKIFCSVLGGISLQQHLLLNLNPLVKLSILLVFFRLIQSVSLGNSYKQSTWLYLDMMNSVNEEECNNVCVGND